MLIPMRSRVMFLVVFLYTSILTLPVILASYWSIEKGFWWARLWSRWILDTGRVRVELAGVEKLPSGPMVVLANHNSHVDVLCLLAYFPAMLRFVAKKELGYIPVFGWAIRAMGHILIDRGNSEKARASITAGARRIRDGTSIVVFPEGTRSTTGKLLPFKKGGFLLAMQAGVPLVPITITGTRALLPAGSWRMRSGLVQITIHDPIDPSAYTPETKDELIARVAARIGAALDVPRAHSVR